MIRTRDLVLFVLSLFMLGLAILTTVAFDRGGGNETVFFVDDEAVNDVIGATTTVAKIDRAATIERLREQLAANTSSIKPEPDVFAGGGVEETIVPVIDDSVLGVVSEVPNNVTLRSCLYPDDTLPRLASWPLKGTKWQEKGGFRLLMQSQTVLINDAVASGTPQTELVEKILVSLPITPPINPVPSCVPSEVIGVTLGGTPILNSNVNIWQATGSGTLIGYARDGHPIYGRYEGVVDECGGYDPGTGYRYAVSSRPFIVGCFVSTPQTFIF